MEKSKSSTLVALTGALIGMSSSQATRRAMVGAHIAENTDVLQPETKKKSAHYSPDCLEVAVMMRQRKLSRKQKQRQKLQGA